MSVINELGPMKYPESQRTHMKNMYTSSEV